MAISPLTGNARNARQRGAYRFRAATLALIPQKIAAATAWETMLDCELEHQNDTALAQTANKQPAELSGEGLCADNLFDLYSNWGIEWL